MKSFTEKWECIRSLFRNGLWLIWFLIDSNTSSQRSVHFASTACFFPEQPDLRLIYDPRASDRENDVWLFTPVRVEWWLSSRVMFCVSKQCQLTCVFSSRRVNNVCRTEAAPAMFVNERLWRKAIPVFYDSESGECRVAPFATWAVTLEDISTFFSCCITPTGVSKLLCSLDYVLLDWTSLPGRTCTMFQIGPHHSQCNA